MKKTSTNISTKNKNVFQCDYCLQSFSRHGAFRNHLRSHRDQMYLDENELSCNISIDTDEITPTTIGNIFQENVLTPIPTNYLTNPSEEDTSEEDNQCHIEQVM